MKDEDERICQTLGVMCVLIFLIFVRLKDVRWRINLAQRNLNGAGLLLESIPSLIKGAKHSIGNHPLLQGRVVRIKLQKNHRQ